MKKKNESSEAGTSKGVHTPPPPQHMNPSTPPRPGKDVLGDEGKNQDKARKAADKKKNG